MRFGTTVVRGWAEEILRQLGAPAGHTLEVTAGARDELGAPEPGPAFTSELRLRPDEGRARGQDGDEGETGGAHGPGADAAQRDGSVSVTLTYGDGSAVHVLLDAGLSEAEAVVLLAGQLQESVLEAAGGAPVPPCPGPGHGHPPAAEVVGGTASWVCPKGGGTRPLLPAAGAEPGS